MFPYIEDIYYSNSGLRSRNNSRSVIEIRHLRRYQTIFFSRKDNHERVSLNCSKVIEILLLKSIEDLVLYTLDNSCDIRRFAYEKIKELEKNNE